MTATACMVPRCPYPAVDRGRCRVHRQTTTERGYGPDWQALRRVVLERDGYRCQVRGEGCTGTATQVDHIRALAHGGMRLDPANCRASCGQCNASAGGKTRRWR